MQITERIHSGTATLRLTGKFVFDAHRDFRNSYKNVLNTPGVTSLEIDLEGVDYIDSSALGSLLLAKELAASQHIQLKLIKCKGLVREILDTANFGKIFQID